MTSNAYIHIPFCNSKCKYCSFVSFPLIEKKEEYISALKKEISKFYKNESLKTLYFGGGTPSILSSKEFDEIIKLFNIDKSTEITAEINPEGINSTYLKELKKVGVNRLSIGCQSFDNKILKEIGRRHNAEDVINLVKKAKDTGFKNISLDFIYGLPNQNLKNFINDLQIALDLDINHISLYGLKIEKGCYFYLHKPNNIANDDIQADMYLKAIEILTKANFDHYEISNFAQKGFESKHNLNYWDNNTYYGFGIAAHGYEGNTRYYNTSNLKEYLINPTTHKSFHILNKQEQLEEEIFLGFRKTKGINIEKINKKFNINFEKKYSNILYKYISYKYLKETNEGYSLTDTGFLISNTILAEFLA